MRAILLIAAREFRHYTRTRAFWFSMLALPLSALIGVLVPLMTTPQDGPRTIAVADLTGQLELPLIERLEIERDKVLLSALSAYVRENHIVPGRRGALYGRPPHTVTDGEVTAFRAAGGLEAALADVNGAAPPDTPPFVAPPRRVIVASFPGAVDPNEPPDKVARALAPYFSGERHVLTDMGLRALTSAMIIPADLTGNPAARVTAWSIGGTEDGALAIVHRALDRVLRERAIFAQGLDLETLNRIEAIEAPLQVLPPPDKEGRDRAQQLVVHYLPGALAGLLWIAIFTASSLLLSSVLEEKSSRLIETLLSCVSAGQLMTGKLLGVGAISLTIIIVWVGAAVSGTLLTVGPEAPMVKTAITLVSQPHLLASFAFYFLAGYLLFAAVLLAIGSLGDSAQDVQGYTLPVMLVLSVPMFMVGPLVNDPNGQAATIASWFPPFTPFVMMARIGSGAPVREVAGTAALLVLFLLFELWLIGRIFRASVLRTGQPPRLLALLRLAFSRSDG